MLDQVTLAANSAELVVVEGPRAAGKSVLLAIAAARLSPDSGTVWISDRKLGDLQRSSLPLVRRNIAYLPPAPAFLDEDSVLDNVMLPLAVRGWEVDASETGALRALFMLGLDDRRGATVASLSAGERQLVALARAMTGAPAVMILDEPAAGLDADDRDRVVAALAAARADGTAVLCATSDAAFAQTLAQRNARRVRLESGRLSGGLPGISLVPRLSSSSSELPVFGEARRQGSS